MSEMLGADVEELRTLAGAFAAKAETLGGVQRLIDGSVNQLPRYWQGPDAAHFAAQWRGQSRGILTRAAGTLLENADQLRKNADEQEQASSAVGLSGAGGGPSTGPLALGGGFSPGGIRPAPGDRRFWEYDPDGNFFENYVQRPWKIYKFAPDTLRTARDIAFTGDLLLHANDLKNFGDVRQPLSSFMDARWFDMGPTTKFFKNGTELLEAGNFVQDLADGSKYAGAIKAGGEVLGWAGVAVDGISGINKSINGEFLGTGYTDGDVAGNIKAATDSGVADLGRAVIGAAALIPGPWQPLAIVASAGIAVYDNWDKIVDGVQWLGENTPKCIEAFEDFRADAAMAAVTVVGDVVKNPEKLLPWNW